jgi:hypothetical protein
MMIFAYEGHTLTELIPWKQILADSWTDIEDGANKMLEFGEPTEEICPLMLSGFSPSTSHTTATAPEEQEATDVIEDSYMNYLHVSAMESNSAQKQVRKRQFKDVHSSKSDSAALDSSDAEESKDVHSSDSDYEEEEQDESE